MIPLINGWHSKESPFFSVENGGTIGGFLGLLLIELSRAMNFTMEILDPVDAYGSWNQQRNMWTGVIGQLVVGKADIGVSEFTLMPGRMDVVDFTLPLIHSRSRLYFKQPDSTDVHWSGYFQAFSSGIWIMIVTIIITASILLTVMKAKKCFSASLLFENYMRVWGIFCQQSLSGNAFSLGII
ncbi:glutamate [NMDA] receptor subunit 1-like [Ooceraea biroi]|uniref:glutamate [NMDA] receptor subunit 1-like n=1 Tax=Ooceraea biroi TaxID=2015173 RepID=UPI0009716E3B|nr:glutamate [NMDA] receptor subunit 1-like [Ooceraea biroi]